VCVGQSDIYKCKTQRARRYIRTNNPLSPYALHILRNRHEYGTIADTLQLLKTCQKGTRVNVWEALYIQIFHQHKVLNNRSMTPTPYTNLQT